MAAKVLQDQDEFELHGIENRAAPASNANHQGNSVAAQASGYHIPRPAAKTGLESESYRPYQNIIPKSDEWSVPSKGDNPLQATDHGASYMILSDVNRPMGPKDAIGQTKEDLASAKRDTKLVIWVSVVCSVAILAGVIAGFYYVISAKDKGKNQFLNYSA